MLVNISAARTATSACCLKNCKNAFRGTKFACSGSRASAVTSYGLPEIVAGKPTISPASATRTMLDLPLVEPIDNLTRPLQITNPPRASCPSTNKTASGGTPPSKRFHQESPTHREADHKTCDPWREDSSGSFQ